MLHAFVSSNVCFNGRVTTMAREEKPQKDSNSTGGGSSGGGGGAGGGGYVAIRPSSRKQKQKKVPQRGLGVAQLEKIRLEEQHNSDALPVLPSLPKAPCLPLPVIPNFNHNPSRNAACCAASSSALASIPVSTGLPSKGLIFRPPEMVQNLGAFGANASAPLTNHMGWPSPAPAQGSGSDLSAKLSDSCSYNAEKEASNVDPRSGFGIPSDLLLPHESSLLWPLPCLNVPQYQQPSSMVSLSSAACSLPSSMLNFQIEPPSNQSYSNNFTSGRPQEDKMVGWKRPYPFSLDDPPGPSFPYKVPLVLRHPIVRSDEPAASRCNGGTPNFEPGNPISRGSPSCSTSVSDPNSKKSSGNKANWTLPGDFLTLAPPTTTTTTTATASVSRSSKFKHPAAVNQIYCHLEKPDFESLPYQISRDDSVPQAWAGRPTQPRQQPYYSFFPPVVGQNGQGTASSSCCCNRNEVGESLDLNLKL